MLTQIKGPSQHFNAYYLDNRLLIQFVVIKFLETHELVRQIRYLFDFNNSLNSALEQSIHPLYQKLSQLVDPVSDYNREGQSSSQWTKRPLTKLKHYCEQFSINDCYRNKAGQILSRSAQQAWLSALQNLDLVRIFQQSIASPSTIASFISAIKQNLNRLNRHLNRVEKYLPYVLSSYEDNENVLFFLLRKKEDLMNIYGSDFMSKIFTRFDEKKAISELISQRYKNRGFEHLLNSIQFPDMDELNLNAYN